MYFEEEYKKVGTTYEQQQMLWYLGSETYGWMKNSTELPEADTLDEAIEELSKNCGDAYEVVVRLHLKKNKW